MDATSLAINLELHVEDDCLTGSARNGGGAPRKFAGWIGLVAAIDELVANHTTEEETPLATIDRTTDDVSRLRAYVSGAVVTPDDPGWDEARQVFNLTVDQRPAVVAFPEDERDVAAVVAYAYDHGFRVAPQRTGHTAGPLVDLAGTILLKTDALNGVEIDPETRVARVGAGAKWADVLPRASEHGLIGLHGSTPDVSLAGYSLGGGLSWYGRKHGLQANSVTAIELVTADGGLRRVDHENEPDLFWALRGGGGNFGVVTALEFRLYPASEVYAGVMFFPWERASEVLHTWRAMLNGMPDELSSVARIMQFPPLPEVPEPLRGNSFVLVDAAFLGSEADGAELMRPLRELGPAMDTFAMVPPVAVGDLHMDPADPMPYASTHALLGDLPAKAIDDMVAVAGPGSGSRLVGVELRHTGGALSRGGEGHGALETFPGSFLMFAVSVPFEGVEAELGRVADVFAPYRAGLYLNFEESVVPEGSFYSPETYARLQAVKGEYDPNQLFQANHPVRPAG